jgi:hypothetical protein
MMVSKICECIGDTIALKGLCESRADCTVYLNDVRGVTNQMLELLVSDDQPTASDVLASLIAEAAPAFVQLVKNSIGASKKEKTIISTINTARWRTPHTPIPVEADKLRGTIIRLEKSPYLYANIADVELYSDGSGAASENLFVYDLDTGELLDTFAFDNATVGFKSIRIGTKYFGIRKILVAYDASVTATLEIDQHGAGYYENLCKSCACTATFATCAEFDSTGPILYSARTDAINCGMRIQYSIGCSIEPFICINREEFGHGFKYAVAMELFSEVEASSRINEATLTDSEERSRLFERAGTKLNIFMDNISKNVMPDCSICFPCAESLTREFYTIP